MTNKVYTVCRGEVKSYDIIKETDKNYRVPYQNIEGTQLIAKRKPEPTRDDLQYYKRMITVNDKKQAQHFANQQVKAYERHLYTELMRVTKRPHVDVEAICANLYAAGARLVNVRADENVIRIIAQVKDEKFVTECTFMPHMHETFVRLVDKSVYQLASEVKKQSKLKVKYILMPGHVISPSDGESHYVRAEKLANLYGVSMCECVTAPVIRDFYRRDELIPLYPQSDGNYTLPEK